LKLNRSKAVVAALLAFSPWLAQAEYSATLIETNKAWGSTVADFNGDGHDDFFISGHHKEDRLWYWSPTGYVPSPQILVWVDRHDCDAADVNLDGRIDMYCAVGAEKGMGSGPKELWLQDDAGVFQLIENHGADDPYGRGRIPVFFDFNHDGLPDIYLANEDGTRPDGQINHNHVFVNQGDSTPRFVEVQTLATGPRGWNCVDKGDVNGDGWDDLIVCDLGGPPHVYINDRAGNFTELVTPATATKWRDAKLRDMNADGRDDLVLLTTTNFLKVWLNTGSGGFYEAAPILDSKINNLPKWLTVGDFNRDGVQDIYVVQQQSTCKTTHNDTAKDLVFHGKPRGGFIRSIQPMTFAGCGYRADTLDGDKILLMNGDISYRGPNYVIEWAP
jgi:hypothetical protein